MLRFQSFDFDVFLSCEAVFILQNCIIVTPDNVTCPMPSVPYPQDFLNRTNTADLSSSNAISESGRGAVALIGANGCDRAYIYVGLKFDGDIQFEDFNKSFPDTQIRFFATPTIDQRDDALEYDPGHQTIIDIQVSQMRITNSAFLS